MINAVNGTVVSADGNSLVINVSGVEFWLDVSSKCSAHFASSIGKGPVRVLTVFQVREDAMTLFGFIDKAERECFLELVKVPGIAGKGALKILSSISVQDFIRALDSRDISTLSRIPGIGSKTAQKLVLQLRDTLVYDDSTEPDSRKVQSTNVNSYEDVVESFVGMGFERKTVVKALEKVLQREHDKLAKMSREEGENHVFPLLLRSLS